VRSIKSILTSAVNKASRPFGAIVVPSWKWQDLQPTDGTVFRLAETEYPFFIHNFNCGSHPAFGTERMVELSLADCWLNSNYKNNIIEVGAVTPYYWPGRVGRVVDPTDSHRCVTDKLSIIDLDMTGQHVLCISTLEHIGFGDYGLPQNPNEPRIAVDKLFAEAVSFLVTIPTGYNNYIDSIVFEGPTPSDVNLHYLIRTPGPPYWYEVFDREIARKPYTAASGHGSDALVILERGGFFNRRCCNGTVAAKHETNT
jgi:hypothetical protein